MTLWTVPCSPRTEMTRSMTRNLGRLDEAKVATVTGSATTMATVEFMVVSRKARCTQRLRYGDA